MESEMIKSDEVSDEIIGDLAKLSNKLRTYELFCASEVVDDAMITVFGALAVDFLKIQARGCGNLPPC